MPVFCMGKSVEAMQMPVSENKELYEAGGEHLTEIEKKAVLAMRGSYHADY